MWKIKDPELKRKMNQFISDEGINQLCKKQMEGISKCIFFFEDSGVSIRIDKSFFEEFPEYNPDAWNPYPAVKPSASGLYLITVKIKDQPDAKPFVTVGCLDPFGYWEKYTDSEVLAFRELPEAYEKEKEK